MNRLIPILLFFTIFNTKVMACDKSPIGIEIVDYGLYKVEGSEDLKYSGLPGNNLRIQGDVQFIKQTDTIPAAIGNKLGFRYKISGKETGKKIELVIYMYYPEPGLSDPSTGKTHHLDQYSIPAVVGDTNTTYYSFDHEWELLPGLWRREVWYGCNFLGGQTFKVVIPGAAKN